MWHFRLVPCCSWSLYSYGMLTQCWLVTGHWYYRTWQPTDFIFKGRVLAYLTCEHGHIPEDENLHQHTSGGHKSHKAVKDQGPTGASSSGMATVRTVWQWKGTYSKVVINLMIDWHQQKFTSSSIIPFISTLNHYPHTFCQQLARKINGFWSQVQRNWN